MSYSLTTPRPQSSPIYVVYKIGGDPGEGQFLSEPPKEIPHGYTCVYIPDNINPTRTGQLVSTGPQEQMQRNRHGWQSTLLGRVLSPQP